MSTSDAISGKKPRRSAAFAAWTLAAATLLLSSCDGFFGKKSDVSFLDVPIYDDRQVAYVPIQPAWTGFVSPVDVIAGFDELIYVADAGTQEIISYDQSGNELGRFSVPGLKAIAQDRTLDLLAIGTFDTLISGTNYSLSTIYRIEQKDGSLYGLPHARIEKKMVHPFYYKVTFKPADDAADQLTGIGVLADGRYFVSRSGTGNSPLQFGGPDDAVLLFSDEDKFLTPVAVTTSAGLYLDYFKRPSGIVTLAQPPQSPFVNTDPDFVYASISSFAALKVQYIDVQETENGIVYIVKDMPVGDTTKADGFLYEANRFATPADVAYTGDGTNYIFVVDSEKDSLYQFTNTGLEGVLPPAGSESKKNVRVSFGGTGNTLTQFRQPSAVTYVNQIVYVADRGNGRVLRFKLTTDFD